MEQLFGLEGKKAIKEGSGNPLNIALKRAVQAAEAESSRVDMIQYMESSEFDKDLRAKILSSNAQLVDHAFYSVKKAEAVTKFFISADKKEFGLTNLSGSTLKKGEAFVISGVALMRKTVAPAGAEPTVAEIKAGTWQAWKGITGDTTSVLTLKVHKKELLSELPTYAFINADNVQMSYYRLDNPRLWKDEGEIEAELQLATETGLAAHTYVALFVFGSLVNPK